MKAFNFQLEALLKQRKVLLDIAKKNYAEAQDKVNQKLLLIKNLYNRMDEVRVEISKLQKKGGKASNSINQLEEFIEGQKIKIDAERKLARELLSIAEEKQEELVESSIEFKKIEVLKGKRKSEFKKEQKRKAEIAIDDIVSMRHGRRSI